MKIGIFSTFIERDALTLVKAIKKAVRSGIIPDSEISFIFSNREIGENPITDSLLVSLVKKDTPLITFSAAKFKSEIRRKARLEKNVQALHDWRNMYGHEVLQLLPQTDIDILLGDMWVWGKSLCTARNGINLHPALPNGPKGEWYNVIWELIQKGQSETGVMMHKVTTDLDRGPAVTFCRYSIRGRSFDSLWKTLPEKEKELLSLIKKGMSEKEKAVHPLHRKIRKKGFSYETPLIIQTMRSFAKGDIKVKGKKIVTKDGGSIKGGYDLTSQVNQAD